MFIWVHPISIKVIFIYADRPTVSVLRIVPVLGVWSHLVGMVIMAQPMVVFSSLGWSTHPLNSVSCSMGINPLTVLECR